jgi:hypothetical protein
VSTLSDAPSNAQPRNGKSDAPKRARECWAALAPNGDVSTFTSREEALLFAVPPDRVVRTSYGEPLPKAWFKPARVSAIDTQTPRAE